MWAITSEERTKHDKQFDNLKPSGGYITGLYLHFICQLCSFSCIVLELVLIWLPSILYYQVIKFLSVRIYAFKKIVAFLFYLQLS